MAAVSLQPAPIQGQPQGNGRKAFIGALFINQKKTADNQPDYKGQVEIEGRKFWVSSWVRAFEKFAEMREPFQKGSGETPSVPFIKTNS